MHAYPLHRLAMLDMPKLQGSRGASQSKTMQAFLSRRTVKSSRILRSRLKKLMKERGIYANKLAKMAGVGSTAVYDIIQGKSKRPSYDMLVKISKALRVHVAYLIGEDDAQSRRRKLKVDSSPRNQISIIGFVETGAWSAMPKLKHHSVPIRRIEGPPPPRYPKTRCFGLEVADDSMAAATPYQLVRGMTVLCVDMAALQLPVHSGQIYAVRIAHENGKQAQTILRRVVQRADEFDLLSESNAKDNYPALTFPGQLTSDATQAVAAFGLPYHLSIPLIT